MILAHQSDKDQARIKDLEKENSSLTQQVEESTVDMVSEQVTLKAAEYTYRHAIEKIFDQLHIHEPDHLNVTKDSEYYRDQE